MSHYFPNYPMFLPTQMHQKYLKYHWSQMNLLFR
jgi:hypothetical protein